MASAVTVMGGGGSGDIVSGGGGCGGDSGKGGDGFWYKNKMVRAGVSNCMHQCLYIFCTKRTHFRVPGLKGGALFLEL